ncbi:MAG TPA: metal-dependent hydrolase [Anaeromyxobacteraceae bacterium]|nr:metal-dependent hydrolase [Anaeromyxobacteraceae bacterium]
MFIGHLGLAFAAKRVAPRTSLGTLAAASQWVDLVWPLLLLLGVERVRIAPGATAVTPLDFEYYPFTHSLVAVLVWALAFGVAYQVVTRDRRGSATLAALVASHWVLDALTHRPDLPLVPGGSARVGLGLWNSVPATVAVEGALFVAGVASYALFTRPRDRVGAVGLWSLVAFLAVAYAGNLFGSPPPSSAAIGWVGLSMWLLVAWFAWVDRHRLRAA